MIPRFIDLLTCGVDSFVVEVAFEDFGLDGDKQHGGEDQRQRQRRRDTGSHGEGRRQTATMEGS